MKHCITAYTAPGGDYPPYVSVNTVKIGDIQGVEITVRSPKNADGSCGSTSAIIMSFDEFHKFARDVYSFACTGAA